MNLLTWHSRHSSSPPRRFDNTIDPLPLRALADRYGPSTFRETVHDRRLRLLCRRRGRLTDALNDRVAAGTDSSLLIGDNSFSSSSRSSPKKKPVYARTHAHTHINIYTYTYTYTCPNRRVTTVRVGM